MSTNQRIRGRTLQRIRAQYFRDDPLCPRCAEAGITRIWTELDHVVALTNGGTDTDDNRVGLCSECHAIKTAQDLGHEFKPRVMIGIDGYPVDDGGRRGAPDGGGRSKFRQSSAA